MRVPTAGAVAVLVLVLVLAACGGGGGGNGSATDEPTVAATDAVESDAVESEAVESEAVEPTEGTGGSTGGGSSAGFGSTPCELLTQAAVETATGASGLAPTAVPVDATSGLCSYRGASGAEVVLSVWEGDIATSMWLTMDMIVAAGGEGIERVDGLGADAVWSSGDGTLILNKDGSTVQVAVRLPDKDPAGVRPIAEDLARQIAAKL